jgi:hypothetical protein
MTGNRGVRPRDLLIWVLLGLACWAFVGVAVWSVVWVMFR